jgi:hypothetical protein
MAIETLIVGALLGFICEGLFEFFQRSRRLGFFALTLGLRLFFLPFKGCLSHGRIQLLRDVRECFVGHGDKLSKVPSESICHCVIWAMEAGGDII